MIALREVEAALGAAPEEDVIDVILNGFERRGAFFQRIDCVLQDVVVQPERRGLALQPEAEEIADCLKAFDNTYFIRHLFLLYIVAAT